MTFIFRKLDGDEKGKVVEIFFAIYFILVFLIILFFEIVQFVSCLGFFDIDDIILNVGSSLLGYGICLIVIH